MRSVPIVKVFISSPGDVKAERERAAAIIQRLSGEFRDRLELRPILYEEKIYSAQDGGFQAQIEQAADCDIVLTIFWGRLGTPLPDSFPEKMEGGQAYPSGTAYELLTSLARHKETRERPAVYVFRKTAQQFMPDSPAEWDQTRAQRRRLDDFFSEHFESADRGVMRAVERFKETEEFGDKVEKLLREWIKNFAHQAVTWPVDIKGTPFRGLEPFNFKQAEVYFGRERKVQRALDELLAANARGKPFLLIPGASGAGKSSMMRAGLAPRIVQPGAIPGVDLWRIAVVRPGTEKLAPFLNLARALFSRGDGDDEGGFGPALPELADGSYRGPDELAELMEGPAKSAVRPIVAALDSISEKEKTTGGWTAPLNSNLLLLVDQFEEIFSPDISDEIRKNFVDLLQRLVATQRVWVIATLRADMYQRMIQAPFIELKDGGGQYDLSPPGLEELSEIIYRSTRAADLSLEVRRVTDEKGIEREERLEDRLLEHSLGANTLPLLQFALDQIFKRCWSKDKSKLLTFKAYEESGGIDGSIEQAAEKALAGLVKSDGLKSFGVKEGFGGDTSPKPLSEKEIAERVAQEINPILESLLRELVVYESDDQDRVDGAADGALRSRMIPLSEARRNDQKTMQVIDALLMARILLVTRTDKQSLLGIAHDRVLVSWKRAQVLIKKNNNFYRVRDSVDQARRRWKDGKKRDELLLPAGAPVAEAEEMLADYGAELSENMRNYIRKSVNRAKLWRRITVGLVGLFAGLAIAATGSAIFARYEQLVAVTQTKNAIKNAGFAKDNFALAQDTIDQVIAGFSENLRDVEGISVKSIETALKTASDKLTALEEKSRKNAEDKSGSDNELPRVRANMHHEFAKVFQNSTLAEKPMQRALEEAHAAFAIRSELASKPDAATATKLDLANSYDQIGDVLREMARDLDRKKNPEATERFAESRAHFDRAYAIRNALLESEPANPDHCFAVSQSLIRLGDCKDLPDNNQAEAYKDYERALDLAARILQSRPEDVKYHRELTWPLSKLAFLIRKTEPKKSALLYGLATDIRQLITKYEPGNTLWKRDLAFSLVRLSEPYVDMDEMTNAENALLRALVLRKELVSTDSTRRLWRNELSEGNKLTAEFMLRANRPELAIGFFVLADDALDAAIVSGKLEDTVRAGRNKKPPVDLQSQADQAKELIKQNYGEEKAFFQRCKAEAEGFVTASQQRNTESQNDRLAAAQKRWERLLEELKSKEAPSLAVAIYKFVESPSPLAGSGSSTPAGQ